MNTEQLAAAFDRAPIVAVVACPGSGKTRTLVGAVNQHIESNHKILSDICVVTYTNAAANEVRRRLAQPIGYCGTLHGFCLRFLQEYDPKITLIDEQESMRLLKIVADKQNYKGSNVALLEARSNFWAKKNVIGTFTAAERVVLEYAADLRRDHLVEYDLLLARALRHLESVHRGSLPVARFFIDEFQDSADVDMRIFDSFPHCKLFVVGDSDQSIYSFRGANPEHMLRLYEQSSHHQLSTNYRSTGTIVQMANQLISHNRHRINLQMVAAHPTVSPDPTAFLAHDSMRHDMEVAALVCHYIGQGTPPDQIAVLCRTNDQVASMKAFLEVRGLEVGAAQREEIPDLARVRTLIGLALNPGSEVLQAIEKHQRRSSSLLTVPVGITTTSQVLEWLDKHHSYSDPMHEIIEQIAIHCPEDPRRMFEYLRRNENQLVGTGVRVGTMHWSKGQEFSVVIIAHADEDERPVTEEDRRLFYVALTRAKQAVHAVGMARRYVEFKGLTERRISRFVTEAGFIIQ